MKFKELLKNIAFAIFVVTVIWFATSYVANLDESSIAKPSWGIVKDSPLK